MTARGVAAERIAGDRGEIAWPVARSPWRSPWRWLLLIALWSVPGLVSSTQVYFLHQRYEPMSFFDALLWQMPGWLFWVPTTPVILGLLRVFPFNRRSWQRSLPVHLVAGFVVSVAHLAVSVAAGRFLIGYPYYRAEAFGEVMLHLFIRNVHLDVVVYVGVVAGGYAIEYYRRFRQREVDALRLEARLARAELQALESQLQPHFLFNTLNVIAVLVRKQETERAVRTLSRLGDLLRMTLDRSGRQVVPLAQELEFLRGYLEIQQIRFQDRLAISVDADDDCLEVEVPWLCLQPLVENAVRHGLAPRPGAGRIAVTARRRGDMVDIEVTDDGLGLPDDFDLERCRGIGVANVVARLSQLYGDGHVFELGARDGGGTRAFIELPAVGPRHVGESEHDGA